MTDHQEAYPSSTTRDALRGATKENTPDLVGIQRILDTTLGGKTISGTVGIDELQTVFDHNNGQDFPHYDGYFHVTGLVTPSEGNLVRIKTTPDGKTLWYPTKVDDLTEAIKQAQRQIKRVAGDGVFENFAELKASGVDINVELARKEHEALERYKVIDFGCGDGRMPIVAAAHGLPSIGIDLDKELLQMATTNISSAAKGGLLTAPAEVISGSFFDDDVLHKATQENAAKPNSVCYLYVTPNTWQLLPRLIPHLRTSDLIVTYKEKLSPAPEYGQIADRIKDKNEYFMFDPPINVYTIK
jgi:hypothetical protein